MIDLKTIIADPELAKKILSTRMKNADQHISDIVEVDSVIRRAKFEIDQLRSEKRIISDQFRDQKDDLETLRARSQEVQDRIIVEESIRALSTKTLNELCLSIPNFPARDVPVGDETKNIIEYTNDGSVDVIDNPRDHVYIGTNLGLDSQVTALVSGSRFSTLTGPLALLERALGNWMLDCNTTRGYLETSPPTLVKSSALVGTGQLPKFSDDLFSIRDHDLYLIPTAEVSLTNLARETIFDKETSFPFRLQALTPCYRAEAGSAGRDTRGLIRQHQFKKVELVTICKPEQTIDEYFLMLVTAEHLLKELGLRYRRVLLSSGDMGFSARQTYDLEVWLPGQNAFREISSISDCGDFQARRMDARYRDDASKPAFLHTLNGSALAVGRTLVAVLENYQNEDGTVRVPAVLQPYMGGVEVLTPS